ncbi:hypothetical protein TERMP_02049 [Thermococcus barophilus MP]|uniref:Uncharacterized protein n=2 Tax=Thermococcus barophilus TaxID=55802 RepID=F0LLJ4_THEBM|nr:hypothetical protein TERMP_02049 [Thermococcus barophilus MP]
MKEFEKALKRKDCEAVLEHLDDYLEEIEKEDELRELLKKLEDLALECEGELAYELAHEIAHIYAHLDEIEKGIEVYKKIAEKHKGDEEKYSEALYYLADAYEHFGMPDKAIDVYEKLLELERKRGDKKEEALTLAHMAVNYEELGDLDKAIELMEKARTLFEELGDEKNYLISLIDLAHFYYEKGEDKKAEELIKEVLKTPRDTDIEINARLIEAEVYAGREDYKGAFKSLSLALAKAEENEELFEFAFDTLTEFVKDLFNEKLYREVYENIDVLVNAFEEDKELKNFFTAIRELAKMKEGRENKFEEVYSKISNESLSEILEDLKSPTFLNIGI